MVKNYIIIVRDYNMNFDKPSDEYLRALDGYYKSPVIEINTEDIIEQLDKFNNEYEKYYAHFFNRTFELVPV